MNKEEKLMADIKTISHQDINHSAIEGLMIWYRNEYEHREVEYKGDYYVLECIKYWLLTGCTFTIAICESYGSLEQELNSIKMNK